MTTTRRLAAILAADVVGYSRLMAADEAGTLARFKLLRSDHMEPALRAHGGRLVGEAGDSLLVEFGTASAAVACAVDVQAKLAELNAELPEDRRMRFRMGVNLGEVIVDGATIHGDGVNIAARLEKLAEPGGIVIAQAVYQQIKGRVPGNFEDLGDQMLHNISDPVRAYRSAPLGSTTPERKSKGDERVTVAVLPFSNMSGDPEQEYFADGITEDLITALARFPVLSVIARNSTFLYKGRSVNVQDIGRELDADYVIEGSVRKGGSRARVTAQLIETRTGSHIWAERYDRDVSDIFAVQDEVVSVVVATLEGRLTTAAAVSARRQPTTSWSAYDFLLQGRELANAHREREAVPLFARAAAIDPNFAQAHAWQAIGMVATYWHDARPESIEEASRLAQRALSLDNNDATVHHACGMVALWRRQFERAGTHFDRALVLNPSDIQIMADRAGWLRYSHRLDEALEVIDEALRRTPFGPQWFWKVRGGILLDMKDYVGALDALQKIVHVDPVVPAEMASAYGHLGDEASARRIWGLIRGEHQSLDLLAWIRIIPFSRPQACDHLLEGLRKAGITE